MYFYRDETHRKKEEQDFQVVLAPVIAHRFRTEIEIFESEQAKIKILEHPRCPFRKFAFWGECEIDRKQYYIAANGPLFNSATQVILLER